MLFILSLLAASPASAAGDDVLYYTGHGGFEYTSVYSRTFFFQVLEDEECATVVDTDVWPDDLSAYRVVVAMMPTQAWLPSETAVIQDFLDDGGVFVLAADTTSFTTAYVDPVNDLMASLGVTSRMRPSSSYDSGCDHVATPVGNHPLTDGWGTSGPAYAWSGAVEVGENGTGLMVGESGQTLGAVEGQVVLLADLNLIFDDCELNDANLALFSNLYHYGTSPNSCDMDMDGVLSDTCGGEDCDDCDAEATVLQGWYPDRDGDDYGDPEAEPTISCIPISTFTTDNRDCDDSSALTFPGAPESCDGVDNNCDTTVPANESDADGDGFRICDEDCADDDSTVFPGAPERCDGLDNNCDNSVPANESDADGDGFRVCEADCNDASAAIFPGANIQCTGVDWDCDGTISPAEQDSDSDGVCDPDDLCANADDSLDADGDGVPDGCDVCQGDDATGDADSDQFCADVDCNDAFSATYPGAAELCDGLDNNCDDTVPADEQDADNDGFRICEQDCDDTQDSVFPGAELQCLGADSNCDDILAPEEVDADNDGVCDADDVCPDADDSADTDGDGVPDGCDRCLGDDETGDADADGVCADEDCNDSDNTVFPGAPELCDGLDNGCTGTTPDEDADADQDGVSICDGDCDDADASVRPGAQEICGDGIDNDCDGGDEACPDTEPDTESDTEPDTESDEVSEGCGCDSSPGAPWMALPMLMGLMGLRRRRGSWRLQ